MTLGDIQTHWRIDPTHNDQRVDHRVIYDATVLMVAVVNVELKLWVAYILGVPGYDHSIEWIRVRQQGTLVPEEMARLIFQTMPEELFYSEDL